MLGNKMTTYNLATIFGPNLLHKQKNPEKEFTVQSFARAEESTAVISVVQKMISAHHSLFMVGEEMLLLKLDGSNKRMETKIACLCKCPHFERVLSFPPNKTLKLV